MHIDHAGRCGAIPPNSPHVLFLVPVWMTAIKKDNIMSTSGGSSLLPCHHGHRDMGDENSMHSGGRWRRTECNDQPDHAADQDGHRLRMGRNGLVRGVMIPPWSRRKAAQGPCTGVQEAEERTAAATPSHQAAARLTQKARM